MRGIVLRKSSSLGRHAVDLGLAAVGLRDDAGNWFAMPGDDDDLTTLDLIKQTR